MSAGSVTVLNGGSLGYNSYLNSNAKLIVNGGNPGNNFHTYAGSSLVLNGFDFTINGAPIAGLNQAGDEVTLTTSGIFRGVMSDGTPVRFYIGSGIGIDGPVTFHRTASVPVGPPSLDISTKSTLQGIRQGQAITLNSGGQLPQNFYAAPGTEIDIRGGAIDYYFQAEGSVLNLVSGTINGGADLHSTNFAMDSGLASGIGFDEGSTAIIRGGTIHRASASTSVMRVLGGTIDTDFYFYGSSNVTVGAGSIAAPISANGGSTLTLGGGKVTGAVQVSDDSTINIFGKAFSLAGAPVPGLTKAGDSVLINTRDVRLTAQLLDGSYFDWTLTSTYASGKDWFEPGSVLRLTLLEPGDFNRDGVVTDADADVWRAAYGTADSTADGNFDGEVNAADWIIWRTHRGERLVVPKLVGDYDGDGTIGPGDYDSWRATLGSTISLSADGNYNGIVDSADYVVWRRARDASIGGGGGASARAVVPEPTSVILVMALTGVLALAARTRFGSGD